MFKLGNKSNKKLVGVNPILSFIVTRAISKSKYDFTVFEGNRTLARQRYLKDIGRSWTMNSKHITGNAVDLVPWINGRPVWDGAEALVVFKEIYKVMNQEAKKLGVTLRCGADWKSVDRPHFELPMNQQNGYNILRFK